MVVPLPVKRLGKQVAITVLGGDMQQLNGRKAVFIPEGFAVFAQVPLGVKLTQNALELNPRLSLYPEGSRDIALGALGGVVFDPVKNGGFGGEVFHAAA